MTIVNGYTTRATAKARLNISDTADDAAIDAIVTAVSRAIDAYCQRRFYTVTEPRVYTARHARECLIDDCVAVTVVATDDDGDGVHETTWAAADYVVEPRNPALSGQARPKWRLVAPPHGARRFPLADGGVRVTGQFGFASVTPPTIEEACLLQTARIFRRRETPFGVISSDEFGTNVRVPAIDPDVKRMLDPYRRVVAV